MLDWGEIEIAPEQGGIRKLKETGMLWRIRRVGEPKGDTPQKPIEVTLYLLQWIALFSGLIGALALETFTLWQLRKKKR